MLSLFQELGFDNKNHFWTVLWFLRDVKLTLPSICVTLHWLGKARVSNRGDLQREKALGNEAISQLEAPTEGERHKVPAPIDYRDGGTHYQLVDHILPSRVTSKSGHFGEWRWSLLIKMPQQQGLLWVNWNEWSPSLKMTILIMCKVVTKCQALEVAKV